MKKTLIFCAFLLCFAITLPVISRGQISYPSGLSWAFAGTQSVTIAPQSGLGTGGTAVCDTSDGYVCNQFSGVVKATFGASAPGNANIVQISWGANFTSNAVCQAQLQTGSYGTPVLVTGQNASPNSGTVYQVGAGGTSGQVLYFNYRCAN